MSEYDIKKIDNKCFFFYDLEDELDQLMSCNLFKYTREEAKKYIVKLIGADICKSNNYECDIYMVDKTKLRYTVQPLKEIAPLSSHIDNKSRLCLMYNAPFVNGLYFNVT